MPYVIYQESGSLASAARAFEDARIAGNMELAVNIYREATGDDRELAASYQTRTYGDNTLPEITSCWWIFNASEIIRQSHGMIVSEAFRTSHTELECVKEICRLATKKLGGTWKYYWEY
jgi:hypothetical protein